MNPDPTTTHLVLPAFWQVAGVVLPTMAMVALFIRLGGILTTIKSLERDVQKLAVEVASVSSLVVELKTWRESQHEFFELAMTRIRRLEDHMFKEVK